MRKLGTKSYYKRKADGLVSKIVRKDGICAKCGRQRGVQFQCAHIVGRQNHTLRFDLINVLCMCAKCHRWGHDNPDLFTHWWENKYPARKEYIEYNRYKLTKRTALDYKELVESLQEIYEG